MFSMSQGLITRRLPFYWMGGESSWSCGESAVDSLVNCMQNTSLSSRMCRFFGFVFRTGTPQAKEGSARSSGLTLVEHKYDYSRFLSILVAA